MMPMIARDAVDAHVRTRHRVRRAREGPEPAAYHGGSFAPRALRVQSLRSARSTIAEPRLPVRACARWTAPANTGGATINGYVVVAYRFSLTGRVVSTVTSRVQGSTVRRLQMTLPYGRWAVRVKARNRIGWSAASPLSARVTPRVITRLPYSPKLQRDLARGGAACDANARRRRTRGIIGLRAYRRMYIA